MATVAEGALFSCRAYLHYTSTVHLLFDASLISRVTLFLEIHETRVSSLSMLQLSLFHPLFFASLIPAWLSLQWWTLSLFCLLYSIPVLDSSSPPGIEGGHYHHRKTTEKGICRHSFETTNKSTRSREEKQEECSTEAAWDASCSHLLALPELNSCRPFFVFASRPS